MNTATDDPLLMPVPLRRVAAFCVGIGLGTLLQFVAEVLSEDHLRTNAMTGIVPIYTGIGLARGHRSAAFLLRLVSAFTVLIAAFSAGALVVIGVVYLVRGADAIPVGPVELALLVRSLPLGFFFAWSYRVVHRAECVEYLDGSRQRRRGIAIRIQDLLVATLGVALSLAIPKPPQ